MSLTDTENFDLDIDGGGSPCGSTNLTIPTGECRTVAVNFSPYSVDTCSASLTIDSNSPDAQRISVSLTGTGIREPDIGVSPSTHTFGVIETGSQSDPIEISITNSGIEDLSISEISLTDGDTYFLDVGGGQYPAGSTETTIPPGQTRTVTVAFAPDSPGTFAGELKIVSNDPDNGTASVVLSGTGVEAELPDRTVTLEWKAPDTNVDGTPATDLSGFKIYFGTTSGNYTDFVDVGYIFTYTMEDLPSGTLYFCVTVYDTMGNESDYSQSGGKPLFENPLEEILQRVSSPGLDKRQDYGNKFPYHPRVHAQLRKSPRQIGKASKVATTEGRCEASYDASKSSAFRCGTQQIVHAGNRPCDPAKIPSSEFFPGKIKQQARSPFCLLFRYVEILR
jgi:hypothetical protein